MISNNSHAQICHFALQIKINKKQNALLKKKIGFFCDFYLFLSLPNQELKINKNHKKIQIFFFNRAFYFYLQCKVANLSMGVITDHPQARLSVGDLRVLKDCALTVP